MEEIGQKITGIICDDIYTVYTDYETDFTKEYTCLIGNQVEKPEKPATGLIGRAFEGGIYTKFVAKRIMLESFGKNWQEIWAQDAELERKYSSDSEIDGPKSQQGEISEVDIFIALK